MVAAAGWNCPWDDQLLLGLMGKAGDEGSYGLVGIGAFVSRLGGGEYKRRFFFLGGRGRGGE